MKAFKYILLFVFSVLLNRNISATEIVAVNTNVFYNFAWVAYFPKLKANGWTTKQIAETNLKNLWKQAFIDNKTTAFQTIWNNQALRNSLFDLNSNIAPVDQFDALINSTDSILYSFIKVE